MTNRYRLNFDYVKVMSALERKNLKLWKTLSAKGKTRFTKLAVLQAVRTHELNIKEELAEAEAAIKKGWANWEEYLNSGERCDLDGGYQRYVTLTFINKWR